MDVLSSTNTIDTMRLPCNFDWSFDLFFLYLKHAAAHQQKITKTKTIIMTVKAGEHPEPMQSLDHLPGLYAKTCALAI